MNNRNQPPPLFPSPRYGGAYRPKQSAPPSFGRPPTSPMPVGGTSKPKATAQPKRNSKFGLWALLIAFGIIARWAFGFGGLGGLIDVFGAEDSLESQVDDVLNSLDP